TLVRLTVSVTSSSALGDGQRDVVVLFTSAEPPHFIQNSRYDALRGQMPIAPQRVDQARLSKFLVCLVERLGYSIGIDCQDIPSAEGSFLYETIPIAEQAQHSGRGFEAVQSVVIPQ